MEYYELERVWLCKLAMVIRVKGIMVLQEENSHTFLLVMDKIIEMMQKYSDIRPSYLSLSGDIIYHGTQKGVFTPKDLNKIFVVARKSLQKEDLTEEEKKKKKISKEHLKELEKKYINCNWK